MFIRVAKGGAVTFEERDNFRAFKIVAEMSRDHLEDVRKALANIADVPDHETAWVFADALRNWPGVKDDPAWQESFSAMIQKARPHGWIDDARNAIKAHIEWKS
jgi:hypothetical protein